MTLESEGATRRRELPGGGTLSYQIDTDDIEMDERLRAAIDWAVMEERVDAE